MDRRSWLWRRKSSEKSPGETESSGSISSHSERFSDDQAYPAQAAPSPEVTSKAAPNEEEVADVKTLTEKLSAALLNIRAKEDLVKQHAKVAEEAVSGWEKAENEVLILKQQLDAVKQKNSVLEDRVSHLDGALRECMRQLRQAREEQEQKIHEAVANYSQEWESKKSELEGKVVELEAQLQTARSDPATSICSDLHQRLEDLEKENLGLKMELQSRLEELEFRIIERDLSTQAAETASKQHLESIKKVAKLDAECRRLKAMARKTFSLNDHRSLTASSVYVESFTDSMSDSGERLLAVESECEPSRSDSWAYALITEVDQFKNERSTGKNRMVPSTEINLMDDFLEMERLAALPDTESGSSFLEVGPASDQPKVGPGVMKAEVEALFQKNAELEKKLEKIEADKLEVEMSLTRCKKQLEASEGRIMEAELKVAELQTQLALANKSNQEAYEELKATQNKNEIADSKLRVAQTEVEELISKICSLEEEIEKERGLSAESSANCGKLEDELLRMKHEVQLQKDAEILHKEKQLEASESWINEAELKVAELQTQLALANKSNQEACEELKTTQNKNEIAESKLKVAQTEEEELISKICSLEEDFEKERALSSETLAKCGKLEDELLRMKHEVQLQKDAEILHRDSVNSELKLKQEKELALAASKFADCQKTIASLGQQLKSLATLEDFLLGSEKSMKLTSEVTPVPLNDGEHLKLHISDLSLPKRVSESLISLKPSITFEKSRSSSGRFIPRSKSVSRTRNH